MGTRSRNFRNAARRYHDNKRLAEHLVRHFEYIRTGTAAATPARVEVLYTDAAEESK